MSNGAETIFTRITILLMAALLCLPCSAKQDLKQALDIPIASWDSSHKPNKTVVCQTLPEHRTQTSTVNRFQKHSNYRKPCRFLNFYRNELSRNRLAGYPKPKRPSPVAIHKLHEQYLI